MPGRATCTDRALPRVFATASPSGTPSAWCSRYSRAAADDLSHLAGASALGVTHELLSHVSAPRTRAAEAVPAFGEIVKYATGGEPIMQRGVTPILDEVRRLSVKRLDEVLVIGGSECHADYYAGSTRARDRETACSREMVVELAGDLLEERIERRSLRFGQRIGRKRGSRNGWMNCATLLSLPRET